METIDQITLRYDQEDDILEVILGRRAREAISVEQDDEVFLRVDPDTGELVGLTILGFKQYLLGSEQVHTFAVQARA